MQAEMGDYSGLASLGWDTSNNPLVQQQNADAQALAQAQIDAILAAGGTPSADLIAQSGYSQEYVNALRNAYLRELNSRIGSSGGGRVSGGTGDSGGGGNNNVVGNNGIGDGSNTQKKTVDSIRESINLNRPASTLSPAARNIYNNMVRRYSSANAKSFSDTLASAVNEGRITEDEALYIANALGFYE